MCHYILSLPNGQRDYFSYYLMLTIWWLNAWWQKGKQQNKFINRGLVCFVHVLMRTWIDCSSIMTGNSDFRLNNMQSHFEDGILHFTRCTCTIIPLLTTRVNEKYRGWLSYHTGLQRNKLPSNCGREMMTNKNFQLAYWLQTLDLTLYTTCNHNMLWVINTLSTEIYH